VPATHCPPNTPRWWSRVLDPQTSITPVLRSFVAAPVVPVDVETVTYDSDDFVTGDGLPPRQLGIGVVRVTGAISAIEAGVGTAIAVRLTETDCLSAVRIPTTVPTTSAKQTHVACLAVI